MLSLWHIMLVLGVDSQKAFRLYLYFFLKMQTIIRIKRAIRARAATGGKRLH